MTVKGTASSNLALSARFGDPVSHWIIETTKCKQCGKVSYKSRDDAEYAARNLDRPMAAYECFYKNGWHLTTDRKLTTNRKRGRAVDASGPENRRTERLREFESHRFRQIL